MSAKRKIAGQGSIYLRNGWWWCDYTAGGVRRRESCKTKNREEALSFLHRRQGKLASGEFLAPDRVRVRDLFKLLLDDYDVRGVSQAYIASLKMKSILNPALGDIKAAQLSTAQVRASAEEGEAEHRQSGTGIAPPGLSVRVPAGPAARRPRAALSEAN